MWRDGRRRDGSQRWRCAVKKAEHNGWRIRLGSSEGGFCWYMNPAIHGEARSIIDGHMGTLHAREKEERATMNAEIAAGTAALEDGRARLEGFNLVYLEAGQ